MGALKGLAVAVAMVATVPAGPVAAQPARLDAVARWQAQIAEASARFGIPVTWIEHVMRAESSGQTVWKGVPITSKAGAMGLMQLMPATWAAMRSAHGLGANPHDPRDNILAGTAYLRAMYDRFGFPGLFAAYNAGPGRYQAHLTLGQPLPAETRDYLVKVAGASSGAADPVEEPARPPLFIALGRAFDRAKELSADRSVDRPAQGPGMEPVQRPVDPMFVVRGQAEQSGLSGP